MNKHMAETILKAFNKFANAGSDLEIKLNRLEGKLLKFGFLFNRRTGINPLVVQEAVKAKLKELSITQEEGGVTLAGEVSIMAYKREEMKRSELFMSIDRHDESAYTFVMLLIMTMIGAKGVKRCPSCKDYFFLYSQDRKTCNSKCRQKYYRDQRTEEEKEEERRGRRDIYRIKNPKN